MKDEKGAAYYRSVVSSICIVEEIKRLLILNLQRNLSNMQTLIVYLMKMSYGNGIQNMG